MTMNTWLLFLATETALSLSPGPAVFYVVAQGLRGVRRSIPATFGILSANAIYFALSAIGLGALIAASARFFMLAKGLGAAYLIYLGVKSLLAAAVTHATALSEAAAGSPAPANGQGPRIYLGALALQLSNPKALLFFLALLPQFIDTHDTVMPQMTVLAATSMLPEFCILLAYGWLAHRAARASVRLGMAENMNRWLRCIEGLGLLGCATLVLKVSPND